jgi:GH15 family glucan-1,4-alpha-glucosidase
MAEPISDYALVGDCETAALISRGGSVDWICWPRFDSDASFAALLGGPRNGRWLIAPVSPAKKISRCYRKDTLVLETTFETDTGRATIIDFMPLRRKHSRLMRMVRGDSGSVKFGSELIIRFGYGEIVPWVTRLKEGGVRAIAGPDMLVLRCAVPLHGENLKTMGEFEVKAGQTETFALSYGASHLHDPSELDPDDLLRETEHFWREWSGRADIGGRWSEAVKRSLITLKALTYSPTGGLVAAPTTSLPEQLGGSRNWDYRYCWLRDATLTLLAFMNTGFYGEARAWRDWLLRAVAGNPGQMQIMYGLAGERRLPEYEIPWLTGFENSRPVRIGNAAHEQLQLDVYGELIDALHQARTGGLGPDESGWELQKEILNHLESLWQKPDHGIWEVRTEARHFTHSKAMAWLAFDRAIKSAEQFKLTGPVARWRAVRQQIHENVCAHGYDAGLGSFVRSYGTKDLDASLLLLPAIGFLPPDDPRITGTVAQIERTLMRDGFLLRYKPDEAADGLPGGEGAFLACSFWLVDAYVLLNRHDDAAALFERLVALCNDVGLLSEEYDVAGRNALGNFPQAFSHLSLVNSACNLSRWKAPAQQRTETETTG